MNKINNKLKLLAAAQLIIFCVGLNIFAQTGNSFSKSFSNGYRIFSEDYTITEFRSRPAADNPGIAAEKLFERRELKIRTYELWLQTENTRKPEIFWTFRQEVEAGKNNQLNQLSDFTLEDVYFSKSEGYVLYKTAIGLVVAKVTNEKYFGWTTYPATILERSYGFRPIFKAKFKKATKPVIEAEYLSEDDRKIWRWELKRGKWILTADKAQSKKSES